MSLIPLDAWNIGVLAVGYTISIVGGRAIIGPLISRLWRRYIPPDYERYPKLVQLVGIIESFLYTTSILIGQREFIAVWLAIKLAGQWSPTKTEIDRPLYHLFLIGNGLSLIIAGGTALVMQQLFHYQ